MMTADFTSVENTSKEKVDQYTNGIISELYGLLKMFRPTEQKYNLKIQRVKDVMEMVSLKFQSLHMNHEAEINEMKSQLANREKHILLLEEALQEISNSYRSLVTKNNNIVSSQSSPLRLWSPFASGCSSITSDSDSEDSCFHCNSKIRPHGQNQEKMHTSPDMYASQFVPRSVAPKLNTCDSQRSALSDSRIPKLKKSLRSNDNLLKPSEVRDRVEALNHKIAQAQRENRSQKLNPNTTKKNDVEKAKNGLSTEEMTGANVSHPRNIKRK